MPASSNLQSALLQYINVISILTDEIQTGKKELKNMMLDITQNELQAIKQIASQFYSNSYRGELLFKLFEYFENECIKTGEFEKSDDFLNIQYTKKNCHQWFKQVSPKNPSSQRDVIGCVLKSTRNPNVNFLFVAATNYLHYGVALSEESPFNLSAIERHLPTWGQSKQWKKIPDGWISKGVGNLRDFSGDAFKLLSIKDNAFLDNFIADRLQEIDSILEL